MKSVLTTLAVLMISAAAVELACAQGIYPVGGCGPQGCGVPSCGPQGCGSGMYIPAAPPVYPYGGGPWNGGCVPVMPCCPPFNGMLPAMNNGQNCGGCPLPQHPYARSPRDFFMYYDRN